MIKSWTDDAWAEYLFWQNEDRKTLKKINKLLESIERHGATEGEGHPEPLRGNFSGWYSRRIDEKNRLIYRIKGESLEIIGCREHYNDR
ncbi:Txe/YoeB family addiction module toxin [Synergistaceae bacterium OttesenSCG-928-I11]|nr:Txe/YoeB family addiction module toxin [Synergistaceae bacterium OttesenSCG-928-I11]